MLFLFQKITLSLIHNGNHLRYCLFIPLWFGNHHCKYQQDSLHFSAYCLTCLAFLKIGNNLICRVFKGGKEKSQMLKNKIHNHINTFPGSVKNRACFYIYKRGTIDSFLKQKRKNKSPKKAKIKPSLFSTCSVVTTVKQLIQIGYSLFNKFLPS